MITKLLSTAVKLYLRSQVSRVEGLQVKIGGKNRQILKGYIPNVFLSCQRGIYQGLHLREIVVSGKDIAINLPEVLKKKPLRLLEPIVIEVALSLLGEDLEASIDSALLQSGLTDLWQIIVNAREVKDLDEELKDLTIDWDSIAIAENQLIISGSYQNNSFKLSTGISAIDPHTLCLFPLTIIEQSQTIEKLLAKLSIDLGNDVNIEELTIEGDRIFCSGKITVNS